MTIDMVDETVGTEQGEGSASPSRIADRSKGVFFKKRSGCYLCKQGDANISYKNPEALRKSVSEGGRILGARITGVCSKHQKQITKAIKQARMLGLMVFVAQFD